MVAQRFSRERHIAALMRAYEAARASRAQHSPLPERPARERPRARAAGARS
jgi:hypothetical protein